jgi:hypothetical protein
MAAFGQDTTAPVGVMRRRPRTPQAPTSGGVGQPAQTAAAQMQAPKVQAPSVASAITNAPPPVAGGGIAQIGGVFSAGAGAQAARTQAAAATDAVMQAPNRSAMAAETLQLARDKTEESYQNDLNASIRGSAAVGRLGSGVAEGNVLDIGRKRERDLDQVARDVALQAAAAEQSDKIGAAQQASTLAALLGSEDRSDAGVTLQRVGIDSENNNQAMTRALQEKMQDKSLTATATEGAAERALRSSLSSAEIASRAALQSQALAASGSESAAERALRLQLQSGELGQSAADRALREKLGLLDVESRNTNSAADRALQASMQDKSLTSARDLQGNTIASQERMSANELTARANESAAERALRESLQGSSISSQEKLSANDLAARKDEAAASRQQSSFNTILQILTSMGISDPATIQNVMKNAGGGGGSPPPVLIGGV